MPVTGANWIIIYRDFWLRQNDERWGGAWRTGSHLLPRLPAGQWSDQWI
jgi:hypothetical protein